jgi:hypothetical protein
VRDAIVCGYEWGSGTGPVERIAVALARVGAKVLHCGPATSLAKKPDTKLRQIESNLFSFTPWAYAYRLNRIPGFPRMQSDAVTRQILQHARELGLEKPLFIYANLGRMVVPFCETMRNHGCLLVHTRPDYADTLFPVHVEQSDLALVFARALYHRMRAKWGEKIRLGFFGIDLLPFQGVQLDPENPPAVLEKIPRPRLGYVGSYAKDFLNIPVLRELLERRRDWSFISFRGRTQGPSAEPDVPLPNAHLLPWQEPEQFARCTAGFDVGFMPYDCFSTVLFNNPPMKLWDYFALGMPVVATPMLHLWEYENLIYLGETARELEAAVEKALAEPPGSSLRQKRMEVAEQHSAESLGRLLERILR